MLNGHFSSSIMAPPPRLDGNEIEKNKEEGMNKEEETHSPLILEERSQDEENMIVDGVG